MDKVLGKLKNFQAMLLIFVSVLLLSFHYFFAYFINSKYLEGFIGTKGLGYAYAIGSLLNILLFISAPSVLRTIGNYRFTIGTALAELVALFSLAYTSDPILIVSLFIIHMAIAPILFYNMDIFAEKYATAEEMGSIRGFYLTMQNIPPIIAPVMLGIILLKAEYWKVYLIGALFLIPFIILISSNFRNFEDQDYPVINLREAWQKFRQEKNIFDVFVDHFLLHLFYGLTVIYLPIYLIDYVGFSIPEMGIILSIMLLPFILFQIPIGKMEDRYHDEKHVLVLGFSVMAFTFMLIPFIHEKNIILWSAVLFVSRIGASIVEVSSESYFFKHISPSNAGFVSFYRMTRSLPFFIIPPLVAITLMFGNIAYVFFVTGILMLLGVRYALLIKG